MTKALVAVVTGASGTIGRAIAEVLSDQRKVVGLDLVAAPAPFPVITVDVTDRDAVEEAAHTIGADHGTVDIVVNNAGALTMNRFLDLSDQEWRHVFEVNSYGTFLLSQVFARGMRDGGRIINIASVAAKTPLPDQAHYCAAKAAVVMLSRVMALELAPGISVFSVCPGAVDTALFHGCLAWTADHRGRDPEELRAEWLSASRIARFVRPEEIAALVGYLALGPTEALTGHSIAIDGGVAPY